MAAMDFPANPTNGQVYLNYIYNTAKGAWLAKPLTPGQAQPSATAPTSPSNGDQWYNTNDGNLYVYYNDGDTSQWVQIKSDATLSSTLGNRVTTLETYPSGLVPIVPTSVTVGSGTGSANSLGTVTFSGVSTLQLNGVFSSAYKHYKIKIEAQGSVGDFMFARMTTAGTPNTSANYIYQLMVYQTNASGGYYSGSDTQVRLGYQPANKHHKELEISNPYQTDSLMATWVAGYGQTYNAGVLNFGATTSFDGIQIYDASGTLTGTMTVYGYRN